MKGQISIAILCHILVNLQLPWGNTAEPDSSGERVHIRLHIPEVVRQHTHLHKVYKYHAPPLKKLLPVTPPGKAHVSLLGYTTMVGGTGKMAPSLTQLMATVAPHMAPASALTPNYGPALFESYNQETQDQTPAPSGSGGSFLATAPATMSGSVTTKQQQQQQLQQQQMLQQLLKPNIIAAITAAAAQQQEQVPELEPEPELEQNELLNGNFLAALQQELVNKFGYENPKRKKTKPTKKQHSRQKQQKLLQKQHFKYIQDVQSNEQFDDYNEEPTTGFEDDSIEPFEGRQSGWRHLAEPEEEAGVYDSAAAFSGHNNAIFPMDVDEFWQDISGTSSYPTHNGNMYDDFDPNEMSHNSWQTASPASKSYARPTKPTAPTNWRPRSRRPIGELGSGSASGSSSAKARYVKLTKRKKRKNRIKSKRYM